MSTVGNESGKVIEILANKTKVVRRKKFGDKVIKTMSKIKFPSRA